MSLNDRIILDEVLAQKKSEIAPTLSKSDFFEFFTAEQVLKDLDLSYDEIETGLVGEGGDGGIDAIYTFVNGELVPEDPDYSNLKRDITMELDIIQAKTRTGFQETPVERLITISEDLFDLSRGIEELDGVYNASLLSGIRKFRETYQSLAARFPSLRVMFVYASRGSTPAADGVLRKVAQLQSRVRAHFSGARVDFNFFGATELLELARRAPQSARVLRLAENPISSSGEVGFVCLVRLEDYFEFITDNKQLARHIFEANVRDYQGRTEVNDDIQQSLCAGGPEDFWWLNNGITVVSSRASQSGKTLTIEDPQIVNGLQTSTEVFTYFANANTTRDDRTLLVRVIVPSEHQSRDRIIKATNSQTSVQPASLRATDKIHRDIEEYMRPRGLYYERRKNFYKNQGKPRDKIVSIPWLGQAAMATLLQRPDTARARPSSLLKKDEDYQRVFNLSYPVNLYYVCSALLKRVEQSLKADYRESLEVRDRNNLRFYALMHVVLRAVGKTNPEIRELASVDPHDVTDDAVRESIGAVKQAYVRLGSTDQISKGRELLDAVKGELRVG